MKLGGISGFRWIASRLLTALAVYTLLRLFFLAWNWGDYRAEGFVSLLGGLVHGMRFDLSAIFVISTPFLLVWIWWPKIYSYKAAGKIVDAVYFAVHFVFIALNAADSELVKFNGQRLTWAYFELNQDISRQLFQLAFHYWPQSLLTVAVCLLFWKFQSKPEIPRGPWPVLTAVRVLGVALVAFGIRGGVQNKPLKPAHAYGGGARLGTLIVNSTFTVFHSRKAKSQQRYAFYSDADACARATAPMQDFVSAPWSRQQNVVVIIMESFALEYMGAINGGKGYTPFLDEVAGKGLFFTNAFANGRRSIEAMPSIVASVPSLLPEPFLMSAYQGVRVEGLPGLLARHGYASAFFHGAINGSMFFDSFAARVGFQRYYGRDEYKGQPEDDDGFWGILDEPFFQFAAQEMSAMNRPFFATIFSLSSHQPYPVPEKYKSVLPKGELPIHQSIAYGDLALRRFFESVGNSDWYNDTLFVITADHTQQSLEGQYLDGLREYRVPVIFFHPRVKLPDAELTRPVQHADIEPTILDLLDIEDERPRLVGRSVFGPQAEAMVVNRGLDGYWAIVDGRTATLKFDGALEGFPGPESEAAVKSFIQCFTSRILDGDLHSPRQRADEVSKN